MEKKGDLIYLSLRIRSSIQKKMFYGFFFTGPFETQLIEANYVM